MKRILLLTILIIITFTGLLNAQTQTALIKTDEEGISIKSIDIKAKIIGDIGITTYTIEIFNNLDEDLSGELQFPLSDRQSIIGYSLDINGALRKAVGVEKPKGETTYEDIVSNAVDPGLLEKTVGNNFKTRIYPIPAKDSRIIALEILDNFIWKENSFELNTSIDFKEKITNKNIQIDFIGFSDKLQLENISNFNLKNNNGITSLTSSKAKKIAIKVIPLKKEFGFYQKHQNEYFYYSSIKTPSSNKTKIIPKSINILWDCSRSRKGLVAKEIDFLKTLSKEIKKIDLNIIAFNTSIVAEKRIKIRNGKTKKLTQYLNNIKYDGATQYSCVNKLPSASLNVLCSDGIANFGNNNFKNTSIPTYTITSQEVINSAILKVISKENAGVFINLNNQSIASSIKTLLNNPPIFKGFSDNAIKEYYPSKNTQITSSQYRSMIKGEINKTIALNFNTNSNTSQTITPIYIEKELIDLKQLFIIEKIKELSLYPKKHKKELQSLGLTHNLITDYTSLIVLETLDDYIKYGIVPPNENLKKVYLDNIELANIQKQRDILDVKMDQTEELEDLLTWQFPKQEKVIADKLEKMYDALDDQDDFLIAKAYEIEHILDSLEALKAPKTLDKIIDKTLKKEPIYGDCKVTSTVTLQNGVYLVKGIIIDQTDGMPLPGANIYLIGSNIGTATDFDGHFTIEVPLNGVLEFSYIGYENTQRKITVGKHEDILNNTQDLLQEIVVVGYGRANTTKYKNLNHFLKNAPDKDEYQVFKHNKKIAIKKKQHHIILGETPLVFEDYENEDFNDIDWEDGEDEFNNIDWEDTFSLEIIPPSAAIKLAGDKGKDGIIFLYTKDYVEDDAILIPIKINKYINHNLSKKAWSDIPKSLLAIKKHKPKKRYQKYLKITEKEKQPIGFYMTAGSLFAEDAPDIASKIWSNIAEIQLNNQENIRTLAYQLRSIGKYEEAIPLFEKILALRPDQPIAYRDLAITYSLNNNYDKAINTLENALNGNWIARNADAYDYTEVMNTLYNDYTSILKNKNKNTIGKEYIISADIRVVLTWTSNNTDIDLHLITPFGKYFYYRNSESETIRYNTDITDGFWTRGNPCKNRRKRFLYHIS